MQHAILTAIGADRPGLVDEVSQFIFERGGNIADSRMVNLRGQFAMVVLVGGDDSTLQRIHNEIGTLTEHGRLHAELHPAEAEKTSAGLEALPYRLSATAMDQPGLVHRIAHLLREMKINIESLQTRLAPAPVTGAPMFEMELLFLVPRGIAIAQLRRQLGELCDQLNIDWEMEAM